MPVALSGKSNRLCHTRRAASGFILENLGTKGSSRAKTGFCLHIRRVGILFHEVFILFNPAPGIFYTPYGSTMIYFITFIITLFLSHIARAMPACGDVASPKELYNPTFSDPQHAFPMTANKNVTWSNLYGNPNGDTKKLACSNFADQYPHFKDFPHFPYIGGVDREFVPCLMCFSFKNVKAPQKNIFITIVNSAATGFDISKEAFEVLNGGVPGKTLEVEAYPVDPRFCNPQF